MKKILNSLTMCGLTIELFNYYFSNILIFLKTVSDDGFLLL